MKFQYLYLIFMAMLEIGLTQPTSKPGPGIVKQTSRGRPARTRKRIQLFEMPVYNNHSSFPQAILTGGFYRLVVLYPLPNYRPMPYIVNGIYGQCYNFLATSCMFPVPVNPYRRRQADTRF